MIDCIRSLRKVNKDTWWKFNIIEVMGNIACKVQYCMLSWVIYLKIKLIFVKEIFIYQIFIQMIIHNTFKHFGRNWKNRNWSVVLKIFFITFLKNWNVCDFKFSRKDYSFKWCLKIFEENDLYRIVYIHQNIKILPVPYEVDC